jgi:hypothetical protein
VPSPAEEHVDGDLFRQGLVVDDAADDARQPGVVGAKEHVEAIAGLGGRVGELSGVQSVHSPRTREGVGLWHDDVQAEFRTGRAQYFARAGTANPAHNAGTVSSSSRRIAALAGGAALFAALVAGVTSCGSSVPPIAGVPAQVDFNFHVKPILSDRCFKCHGPDERQRKAGLRLDIRDAAFAQLASGHRAVVAGKPAKSELVRRITSTDPKVMMPAPESHLTLDEVEKATLIRWIEQGAEWKPHWAFIPPVKPAPPAVTRADWPRGDLDRFVLAALEAKGWTPSPEADRETWLRRVSFDLTGLPPAIADIDAFLADRSPDAYERVVDRLLASPAYGERMAADWLDVARYADSHGYQDDGMREMWPWRDWVIRAFNRNLRVDQFITWQLAGDLLPDATAEQRLATGFNRNHMQSQEGGIVAEEYRTEYVVDRVNTLGRAFLGLSVECARCHDHKYDPVTQKEFYRLYSFFNNVNENGQIPYSGVPSPTVIVTTPEDDAKIAALGAEIRKLEAELDPASPKYDAGFARWLEAAGDAARAAVTKPGGLVAHFPFEAPVATIEYPKPDPKKPRKPGDPAPKPSELLVFANLVDAKERGRVGDKDRPTRTVAGKFGEAAQIVGDSFIVAGREVGIFERNQPFSVGLWVRVDKAGTAGPLLTRTGGVMDGYRGYDVLLRPDGSLVAGLHHVGPDNEISIQTGPVMKPGTWQHLLLTYDGSSRAAGIGLFVDGLHPAATVVMDHLRRSIINDRFGKTWTGKSTIRIGRRGDETLDNVTVDDLRVYDRQLSRLEAQALAGVADPLGEILRRPVAARTASQQAALREHYLLRVDPAHAATLAAATKVRGEENAVVTALVEVMAMRDRAVPRPTFVLARGAYDAPTERVDAGTPAVLGPFPKDAPPNRLGLARWLTAAQHPLTARVVVNRYWAQLFGRGIVATPADFGSQGRLPSHPALLDYLATTFVESGWDLKAFQKRVVLSATYRQASLADAAARERDPANEWLSRGPAYRLSAEEVRDGAMAAGGLLVKAIGGPSVYPYQPEGLWEALATRNATTYTPGTGDDLHRRSLYTVWKRSSPPPGAVSFDAAERLVCSVSRQRTNTPLQALVLLNDPQFVEAARALAARMIREGGVSDEARVGIAFRALTGRAPIDQERGALVALYRDELAGFRRDRASAAKLLAVGEWKAPPQLDAAELAASTIVASTVMNTDAALMKR